MRRLYGHCVGLPSSIFGQFGPALATCLWLQLFNLKPEVQIKVQTEKGHFNFLQIWLACFRQRIGIDPIKTNPLFFRILNGTAFSLFLMQQHASWEQLQSAPFLCLLQAIATHQEFLQDNVRPQLESWMLKLDRLQHMRLATASQKTARC
jgi:hypothetical protein